MRHYSNTDIGKKRIHNEDYYLNIIKDEFSLFIIADGMGGHNAGEVASEIAVKSISEHIQKNFSKCDNQDLLVESIKYANENIYKKSLENESYFGMGTTIIVCFIVDDILYYSNVGDSRIYIFRDEILTQISHDHSYVQELLDAKAITEEEAKFFPRNKITSALGFDEKYKINIREIQLYDKDILLMSTDGLTDLIEDEEIENVLQDNNTLEENVEILNYMANSTGGYDNITITIIEFEKGN